MYCRQVSSASCFARWAVFQVSPPSVETSTFSIPRCGAQAIPPIGFLPEERLSPALMVSIRDWVLMGPSFDQVRWIQYASKFQLVSSISVSHLVAETYPYRPGMTSRTG